MHSRMRVAWVAILCASVCTSLHAAQDVGSATFSRGAVTGQTGDGDVRILDRGSPLFEGDVIRTGDKSAAVLRLKDSTRMALRPRSVFRIENYSETAGKESAFMRLFKGGMRSISGALSKRNRNAFKVRTAVATIGIRGTEYDVRLCAEDCRAEAENFGWASKLKQRTISGRVGLLRGTVSVRNESGVERNLSLREPLFEGDIVKSAANSFAILVFTDKSRVTLPPKSSFQIEKMRYDAQYPKENTSIFRLIRGGLRQVTGLIGRNRPGAVRVRTAVATIGIRGTGFDLYCDEGCADIDSSASENTQASNWNRYLPNLMRSAHAAAQKGLIVDVWRGAVQMDSTCGSEAIEEGTSVSFELEGCKVERTSGSQLDLDAPKPDEPEIDFEELFDVASEDGEPGLYLACIEGSCTLTNDQGMVELTGGEAAYASGPDDAPKKLDFIPPFQSQDPWLEAIDEDKQSRFNLLDDDVGESGFQCSVF